MKIIGICGSPKKKNSTTEYALNLALEQCKEAGIETSLIRLCDHNFSPCIDCGSCSKGFTCSQDDDFKNKVMPVLDDDDVKGFIFGSPVYFGGMTAQMKAFFDRCLPFRRNGFKFENKLSVALTIGGSRNGGQELTAMDIVKASLIHSMIIIPDSPPTSHFGANLWGRHPKGIENEETGLKTAINAGKKMAEIVKKMYE